MINLFLTCSSGLEPLLEEEIKEFGYSSFRRGFCGVYVDVDKFEDIYKLNYASRLASRVLLPIHTFRCKDRQDLYDAIHSIDWTLFFKNAKTLAVDANVDHPLIRNSLFASQVVKDAVCDKLLEKTNQRPSVDLKNPDIQLNLFLRSGKGVISFDTSGEPLNKRGYRQEGGEAPLRETLASALLKLAKYSSDNILIDPCAGSGTFLIEAALIASQTPPGMFRKTWGFYRHPDFNEKKWIEVKTELDAKRIPLKKDRFFGIELNRNTHRICLANLRASGLHPFVHIDQGDFREIEPKIPPNFMITNPPYGRRMEEESTLIPLYRSLGDFMKRKLAKPSKGFILTGSLPLSKEIGLAAKKKTVLDNGGVEARFLEFDIYGNS